MLSKNTRYARIFCSPLRGNVYKIEAFLPAVALVLI
jgi:hypothetical protein